MQQIALDIGLAPTASLENFLTGPNNAVIEHLKLWTSNALRSPVPTYLWGEAASAFKLQRPRPFVTIANKKNVLR